MSDCKGLTQYGKISKIFRGGCSPSIMFVLEPPTAFQSMFVIQSTNSDVQTRLIVKVIPVPSGDDWTVANPDTELAHNRIRQEIDVYMLVRDKLLTPRLTRGFPYIVAHHKDTACPFSDLAALVPTATDVKKLRSRLFSLYSRMSGEIDSTSDSENENAQAVMRGVRIRNTKTGAYEVVKSIDSIISKARFRFMITEFVPGPKHNRDPASAQTVKAGVSTLHHLVFEFGNHDKYGVFPLPLVQQVVALAVYNFTLLARLGLNHNDAHGDNILVTHNLRKGELRTFVIATEAGTYIFDPILSPILFDFDYAVSTSSTGKFIHKNDTADGHCRVFNTKRDTFKLFGEMYRSVLYRPAAKALETAVPKVKQFIQYITSSFFPPEVHPSVATAMVRSIDEDEGGFFFNQGSRDSQLCNDNHPLIKAIFPPERIFMNLASPFAATPGRISAFASQTPDRTMLANNVYGSETRRAAFMKNLK